MRTVTLPREDDFEGWREAARALAGAGVPAESVVWTVDAAPPDLFAAAGGDEPPLPEAAPFTVPRAFLTLAESVVCHADPERFARLYAMLLRLRERPRALEDGADPLVQRLEQMARAVRRDIHKMHAFVRFRAVETGEGPRYVAWFEPGHHIVRAAAGFFVRRFAAMRWSILTPSLSVHWDGETLSEGPGAARGDAPADDPVEAVWKAYYASTFNPARLKVGAMLKEMPRRYWKNMPETALVDELVRTAPAREQAMVAASAGEGMSRSRDLDAAERAGLAAADAAERQVQPGGNALAAWEALLDEAKRCTRCHLYRPATQTVFGEGPLDARILFVGEQPGDQEDLAGRPFVGPAGLLFDRALADAGVDRAATYVTNAVKHFKFELRGRRRIHSKPQGPEIEACRWWIEQERALVRPAVTVALGATAARSIFGKVVTITAMRGRAHALPDEEGGGEAWVTVHPSFLLRVPDEARKREEYARFVEDLARIAKRAEAIG